jgi:hypothetical protein
MKKIVAVLLIAGIAAFVACGGNDKAKLKAREDSLRKDSISKVHKADSLAAIEKANQRTDSLRKDSLAKANKGKVHHGKPKHSTHKG